MKDQVDDLTRRRIPAAALHSLASPDFRPDYRRLRDGAASCRRADGQAGRPNMAALTATATPEVRADTAALLGLIEPRVIVAGLDRPNIRPIVRPVSGEALEHLKLRRMNRVRRGGRLPAGDDPPLLRRSRGARAVRRVRLVRRRERLGEANRLLLRRSCRASRGRGVASHAPTVAS